MQRLGKLRAQGIEGTLFFEEYQTLEIYHLLEKREDRIVVYSGSLEELRTENVNPSYVFKTLRPDIYRTLSRLI